MSPRVDVASAVGPAGAPGPQPVGHLLADVSHLRAERGDVVAELAKQLAEALDVQVLGVAGLFANVTDLAAAAVLTTDDAVIVAAAHPGHDLRHAAHGVGVGGADLQEEATHPIV